MKKLYGFIMAVAALLTFGAVSSVAQNASGNVIYVVTDPHVMDPSLLVNKGSAFNAWQSEGTEMLEQSVEAFEAVVDSAIIHKASVLLICGDLTKDGEKVSHQRVAQILDKALQAGVKPYVIPGNNDIMDPWARYFDGASTRPAEEVTPDEFAAIYNKYGYGEGSERDPSSLSYVCEPIPGLALLCIDALKYDQNKHVSQGASADICVRGGALKPATLEWLLKKAGEKRSQGKKVIAMMHHQLVDHVDGLSNLLKTAAIDNGTDVAQQLADYGVHVVFTGHMHISDATTFSTDYSSIVDISTGSTVTYPFPYREVTIDDNCSTLSMKTHTLTALPSTPDYSLQGRIMIMNNIAPIIKKVVKGNWSEFQKLVAPYAGGVDLGVGGLVSINMPQTPEGVAEVLANNLSYFLAHAWMVVGEGNECDRDYMDDYDMMYAELQSGIYGVMDDVLVIDGLAALFKGAVKTYAWDNYLADKLEPALQSLFKDLTFVGTEQEDRTDDLRLLIDLSTGEKLRSAEKFTLTYKVDGEVYTTYALSEGDAITAETAPVKEGYTFSGWSNIPETMPANDVTITGTFTINQYTINYVIDGETYKTEKVDYNSTITPPTAPAKDGYDFAWGDYPETMPAHDITIIGTYTSGISSIAMESEGMEIYTVEGKQNNRPQKGVNIIRTKDGKAYKLVTK